ncbi:MAG: hypothetical protein QW548_00535 [Candidatus Aenigmatarchaeota archaeon]
MQKLDSQRLLTAVFAIFVLMLVFTVFVPSVTATATAGGESNASIVLAWAVPVIAIVAAIMFYSYKSICGGRFSE